MMPPHDVCPPNEIPASANVTDLSGLTFWGQVSDGRVWFVEFYAGKELGVGEGWATGRWQRPRVAACSVAG